MDKNDLENLFGGLKKSASEGIKRMGEYGSVLKLKIGISEQKKIQKTAYQEIGRIVFDAFDKEKAKTVSGNSKILELIEDIKNSQKKIVELEAESERILKKENE